MRGELRKGSDRDGTQPRTNETRASSSTLRTVVRCSFQQQLRKSCRGKRRDVILAGSIVNQHSQYHSIIAKGGVSETCRASRTRPREALPGHWDPENGTGSRVRAALVPSKLSVEVRRYRTSAESHRGANQRRWWDSRSQLLGRGGATLLGPQVRTVPYRKMFLRPDHPFSVQWKGKTCPWP